MAQDNDNELENLEGYLVGLDELGSSITSDWATESPENGSAGIKDVHKALQDLLQEAVILAKEG